jgi:isoleucyl-tRNA synthetase
MADRLDSVHLAKFPDAADVLGSATASEDDPNAQDWTTLLAVREQALKALEEARNSKVIGKSVEAQLVIMAAEPAYTVLQRHADQLRYLFIVSAVTVTHGSGNGSGGVHIEVKKADGSKCDRCWNFSTHVGEDTTYPTVCERCSAVLKELEAGSGE